MAVISSVTSMALRSDETPEGILRAEIKAQKLDTGITATPQYVGSVARTLADINADNPSVKTFGGEPSSADNSLAINKARLNAKTRNAAIEFPAGVYKVTTGLPDIHEVRFTGNGLLQVNDETPIELTLNESSTLSLYVSTLGDDTYHGFSSSFPLRTIQKAVDVFAKMANGIKISSCKIHIAAGTYVAGASASGLLTTNYIDLIGVKSATGEPLTVIDLTGLGKNNAFNFANNMRIHTKDIKLKGVADGSGTAVGLLLNNNCLGWLDNLWLENIETYGVLATTRSRILVSGGESLNTPTNYRIYSQSSAFIGYNNNRVKVSGSTTGVEVSGSSYAHVDYIDFSDMSYGIVSEYGSHSTNYNNNYHNVTVPWETRSGSSLNSRDYTLTGTSNIQKVRSQISFVGSDVDSVTGVSYNGNNRNIQFYPYFGNSGRWAFGYPNLVTPSANYQFSINGKTSGVTLSSITGAGVIWESDASFYHSLMTPAGSFSGFIFGDTDNPNGARLRYGSGALSLQFNNVTTYYFKSNALHAATDNTNDLGLGSYRWKNIYGATGVVTTSDERLKQNFSDIDAAESRAAVKIKKAIKRYQFVDAINIKQDKARYHFGVGAQTVGQIMREEGLDPEQYAFYCYDEWEATEEMEAGNRYGIRYDELSMFLHAAS